MRQKSETWNTPLVVLFLSCKEYRDMHPHVISVCTSISFMDVRQTCRWTQTLYWRWGSRCSCSLQSKSLQTPAATGRTCRQWGTAPQRGDHWCRKSYKSPWVIHTVPRRRNGVFVVPLVYMAAPPAETNLPSVIKAGKNYESCINDFAHVHHMTDSKRCPLESS